jgi:hypothetical protein
LRSPALISARLRAGCHAVLASLSGRYPPLEGRSPTCYSPVCHSTYPLRGFRVRLACVRHAASVDSEPGSNSQVKFVVPPEGESNSLTLIACLNRLSNVVQFVKLMSGSQPASGGELNPRLRLMPRHPLILDGRPLPPRLAAHRQRTSACTFYLVFKEPDFLVFPSPPADVAVVRGTLQSY